jgi:hypothetical protein
MTLSNRLFSGSTTVAMTYLIIADSIAIAEFEDEKTANQAKMIIETAIALGGRSREWFRVVMADPPVSTASS